MPYISGKKPLTQSQKDDLVHEAFSKVKNDSLDQARIILSQYHRKTYFNYKTPINLLSRLANDSKTIRKNARELINTHKDDFAKYKTVNLAKIAELRAKDNIEPPKKRKYTLKKPHHKKKQPPPPPPPPPPPFTINEDSRTHKAFTETRINLNLNKALPWLPKPVPLL